MYQNMPEDCVLTEDCLDINTGPFTVEESQATLTRLKTGKAPGVDGIEVEYVKSQSRT